MRARVALYALLGVVAIAAAVLSFSALADLALLCGFAPWLAPLLPVVVDAGAAAGSLAWLGGQAPGPARRFGRALALVLLAASVAANALGHGLAAYTARPHWLVVVAVLVGRGEDERTGAVRALSGDVTENGDLLRSQDGAPAPVPAPAPGASPVQLGEADASRRQGASAHEGNDPPVPGGSTAVDRPGEAADEPVDRAVLASLVADGAGRRRAAKVLGVTEYRAGVLLARARKARPELPADGRSTAPEGDRLAPVGDMDGVPS